MVFRIPSRSVDLSPKNSAKYRVVARENERPEGLREIRPSSSRPFVCSYTFEPIMSNRSLWRIGWSVALIAYHQPILQSDLFDMIGSKGSEHTKGLEELGLMSRKPSGRSFSLATTRYFA